MKYLKTYNELNINDYISDDGKILSYINNDLTKLPKLPKTLETLYCYNNKLTELPELSLTLEKLDCWNNNLPYNDLKGYWEWFYEENPDLYQANKMGLY